MSARAATIRNAAKALIVRDRTVLLQLCRIDGREVHLLPGGTQEFGESLADAVRREVHLLPGGTQEFGESLADAVRREVLEETGLRVDVGELVWVREFIARHHLPGDDDQSVEVFFRCTPEAGAEVAPGLLPNTAQIGVRWVPFDELPAITMWPETVQRLLIAWDEDGHPLTPAHLGDCP